MPRYITKVIYLKDDNEYRKGRFEEDIRLYDLNERANKYIRSYIKNYQ